MSNIIIKDKDPAWGLPSMSVLEYKLLIKTEWDRGNTGHISFEELNELRTYADWIYLDGDYAFVYKNAGIVRYSVA